MAKLKYLLAIIGAGLFGGCSKDVVSNHRNRGRDLGSLVDSESDVRLNVDARGSSESDGSRNGAEDLGYDSGSRDAGAVPDRISDGATADSNPRLDGYSPDMLSDRGFSHDSSRPNDGRYDVGVDAPVRDIGIDRRIGRDDLGSPDLGIDARVDASVRPVPYECDPFTIALYRFDQPSPFLDSCGAHDLGNSGTTEVSGQAGFGEARSFDGIDAYLDTPSTEDLNFGSMRDFRIRANMRTTASLTNYDTIMGKTALSPMTGYAIFYYGGWACLYWDTAISEEVNSLVPLNDGLWHEIICERTNNGTRITMYIDGFEIITTTIAPKNTDSSAPLVIGNMRHGIELNQGYFEGEIDKVEIERIE